MKKKITLVCPCFNEEENIELLVHKIDEVTLPLKERYDFEVLFIDNHSSDKTPLILKKMASERRDVKVILNARNFGHIRSPFYGITQSSGDATILMATDFQDPPELIVEFIKKWEEGFPVVMGVKKDSHETFLFFAVRKFYYNLISKISDIELVKNYTGFGLYDKKVIQILRGIKDHYPYFRGIISELGFPSAKVYFTQPLRRRGFSKNNLYTLYDMAMLGITSHSKIPLRIATFSGFIFSFLFLLISLGYLGAKLVFWEKFAFGLAPLIIGIFLVASVQLFFIGILGEYIGFIHNQLLQRPLVIEKERINFD